MLRRACAVVLGALVVLSLACGGGSGSSSGGGGGGGGGDTGPTLVPSAVDPTVATNIYDSTAFLYTGTGAIQTGVADGTIVAKRVAVIRGKVTDRSGNALVNVTVSILNHGEYGSTLTRSDGMFDMAVNGGGYLTVSYGKDGYAPAQRQVQAPWRDYVWADDVILVAYDTKATVVAMGAAGMQVAQGSTVTDDDGTRTATVLFPAGTTATATLPDGSSAALDTITVRATEYTVGSNGPDAMPASLPASSAYTYAVDLSVDEAVAAGATSVQFNHAVPVYLENFLGIPCGWPVPSGYYDSEKGTWIASEDGRVIEILSIDNRVATIDADGDGIAEGATSLAALGVSDAELAQLASRYAVGDTLWRVPVEHFSTWDFNHGWGCPEDEQTGKSACSAPDANSPSSSADVHDPNFQCGSIIDCQNQALGQSVAVSGTPFRLSYRSNRQPGGLAARTLTVHLPVTTPRKAVGLRLEVYVAGRQIADEDVWGHTGDVSLAWDGLDAYGRTYNGSAPVTIKLGYLYVPVYYLSAAASVQSFGSSGVSSVYAGGWPNGLASHITGRPYLIIWKSWTGALASWQQGASDALGGWTLSEHHSYDPDGEVLHRGDGTDRSAKASRAVVSTFANLHVTIWDMVGDADGSLYLATNVGAMKIDDSGRVTKVTDGASCSNTETNGVAALKACLGTRGVAVAGDGTLYISGSDSSGDGVWSVDSAGLIHRFAGGGVDSPGEGEPATSISLAYTHGIAAGADGSVYFLEGNRLRRVGNDGVISTVGGPGSSSSDNIAATEAYMPQAGNYGTVVAGADGYLYLAGGDQRRVRRIGADGVIRAFAGTTTSGFSGDGGQATSAQLYEPDSATPTSYGSVLIADRLNCRLREVSADGTIRTIAGSPTSGSGSSGCGVGAEDVPAYGAPLDDVIKAIYSPDGSIYFVEAERVRKIKSALPGVSFSDEILVASEDGSEVYRFDASGRHLETDDALSGAVRYSFRYNESGYLSTITDRVGNVTTVERDSTGAAAAIVAPQGQRTALSVDGSGYLSSIANPAGEAATYSYGRTGLMATYQDPRGNAHSFAFDSVGRLITDVDPAGGSKSLARTTIDLGYSVTTSTALGRAHTYSVENLLTGDERRVVVASDGTSETAVTTAAEVTTTTSSDGSVEVISKAPDPRFNMGAPIVSSTVTTPAGLSLSVTRVRTATFSSTDVLGATALGETTNVAGNTYSTAYDRSASTVISTTPAGRKTATTLDAKGRPVTVAAPGVASSQLTYDRYGRLSVVTQGSRVYSFGYDSSGNLSSVVDPLSRAVSFSYDAAGRPIAESLPGSRTVSLGYDASGNLTSLAPPGKSAHGFESDAMDRLAAYTPPTAGGAGLLSTTYSYDLDGALAGVLLPDSTTVESGYDSAGRLASVTIARGTTAVAYDDASRVASVTAPGGDALAFGYDGFLPTGETATGTAPGTLVRTFDSAFRVARLTVNGTATAFSYDADSLLTAAGALAITRSSTTGFVSGTTLGTVTTSASYDSYGALATASAAASSSTLYSYTLTRDNAGRITGKSETVGGTTTEYAYTYDAAGRLETVAQGGTVTGSYTYDQNGNRLTGTTTAGTASGDYDAQDRLTSYGSAAYAYGASGNLATRTVGGQKASYSYDALGNLLEVSLATGNVIDYAVDGLNRRVGKKVNGTLTEGFLYDGQLRPVAWLNGSGAVYATFVYGLHVNVPEYMVVGSTTYRFITDHLGSPRLLVNSSTGAIAQRVDYDEWGQVTYDSNPGFQPFGFAGGLYDRDTGLVRFGARDYDPTTGRWTSKARV